MDKTEFFKQLHKELEDKYKIPPHCVSTIRSFYLGHNMDRLDIMDWADENLREYKLKKQLPKPRWQKIFNFLENLSDEAWNDITKKTQFDN